MARSDWSPCLLGFPAVSWIIRPSCFGPFFRLTVAIDIDTHIRHHGVGLGLAALTKALRPNVQNKKFPGPESVGRTRRR